MCCPGDFERSAVHADAKTGGVTRLACFDADDGDGAPMDETVGPRRGLGGPLGPTLAAARDAPGPSLRTVRDADEGRDAVDCALDVLARPLPQGEGVDYVTPSCAGDGAGLGSGAEPSLVVLGADARFRCNRAGKG